MESIENAEDPIATDSGTAEDGSSVKQSRGLDSMFDDVENEETNAVDQKSPLASKQEEDSDILDSIEDIPQSEVGRGTDHDEDDQGDLFSEQERSGRPSKLRQLDDEELDSGDDEDRNDRAVGREDEADNGDEEIETEMDLQLERHHIPEPTGREVFLLKFPYFLRMDPATFTPRTFQLPPPDMNTDPSLPTSLSRFAAATNIIRWRRSPRDPTKIEGDSRVLIWSDGSMTLQIANNPRAQFPLPAKPLVPPSIYAQLVAERSKQPHRESPKKYDPRLDAHMYLTAPQEAALVLRVTNHVTTSLTVMPSSDVNHESLTKLQQSLVAAKRVHRRTNPDGSLSIIELKEDPELAKKRAEMAERDRSRQQKKVAASIMRDTERANRTLAKSGLRLAGGGLSIGGLEGDEVISPRRAKGKRSGTGKRGGRGRLSDSDEDMPRGRTREDEYDKTDDFIVDTDEEEEIMDGDGDDDDKDDDDDELLDDLSEGGETPGETKSPKRKRSEKKSGSKKDKPASGSKKKRRRTSQEDGDDV